MIIDRIAVARGGAESAVAGFARALIARGHRVTFLVLAADEVSAGCDLEVIEAPARPRARRERIFSRLACRRAASADFDVSIGYRHVADVDLFVPHGGRHRRAARASTEAQGGARGRLRRVWQHLSARQRLFRGTEWALLHRREPVRVVALSRCVLDDYRAAAPRATARFVLVRGGVDTRRYHPPEGVEERERARLLLGCPPGRTSLLFVAHNPRLKGLAAAIEVLGRTELRGAHLSWVGRGRPAAWERLARRLGVHERVSVLGEQARTDLLYRGADLLIHPTFHDPCSLVVLEAMASGLPAVTTRRNGAAELIEARGGGAVIDDPRDLAGLARAARCVLEAGPALRDQARRAAETRPIETHHARLIKLVEEAAASRAARPPAPADGQQEMLPRGRSG